MSKSYTIVFMAIFLSIMLFMHFYVFSRLASFFGFSRGAGFYSLIIILSLTFLLANILERIAEGHLARWFYILSATWLGIIFMLFFVTLVTDIIKLVLRLDGMALGIAILVVSSMLAIYALVNAKKIRIHKASIRINGLEHDMRAVHLSDLHLGAVRNTHYAARIAQLVNEQNPDVVFLTGDLADGSGDFSLETIAPLDSIRAPIYYVTGNHENYLGVNGILKLVKKTKIKHLKDELVDFKHVQIAGFDFPMEGAGESLAAKLKSIKLKGKPAILLFHAPQDLEAARKAGFDMMLTGHVHGGQIFPFNLLVRLVFPYSRGIHDYKGMKVVVSMGTGTWGPPMRLGSRNEIIVLDLIHSMA